MTDIKRMQATRPFPKTGKAPATTDNNQRFNDMLNGCQHPRAVYNALMAWATTENYRKEAQS